MKSYESQPSLEDFVLPIDEDVKSDIEILRELEQAKQSKATLTGYCERSDSEGNLIIKFNTNIKGIIPPEEITWRKEKDGTLHKALPGSKVGLMLQFKVKEIKTFQDNIYVVLSRKDAMIEIVNRYKKELKEGMVLNGIVQGIANFGAFVEIGGDQNGVLSLGDITRVVINSPDEILKVGMKIQVIVDTRKNNPDGSMTLFFTRKELLPDWQDIDKYYHEGDVVIGRTKRIITSGIFIELDESFEGLARFTNNKKYSYGERVRVRIDKIDKSKKTIRLRILN